MSKISWQHALLMLVILAAIKVPAGTLDTIGVTVLRSMATNFNGGGIRVAQAEANTDANTNDPSAFEVNPSVVGQPTNLFFYASAAGTATNFPNAIGNESIHADSVANDFYGISGGVATNVAHVGSYDADYFINNYVSGSLTVDAAVVNQSFTFGVQTVADQESTDSLYDDYIAQTGILFASAACNPSISIPVRAPGTAYNCISVGASPGASSIGPTLDNGRCKPDISVPAGDTSSATPCVAGAAAVLMQAAIRGDGGSTNAAFDMRTIKALLLNGAVKPLDWTNANNSPLDARYGAGVLNVLNSYKQLAGGRNVRNFSTNVPAGTAHLPVNLAASIPVLSGWDFNTNASTLTADAVNHYFFYVTNINGAKTFATTITLDWNRHHGQSAINDLDLFLYNAANSNLVAMSTSRVDNVEHIYVSRLPAGRYDVEVVKYGGSSVVSSKETYALAWEFVAPTLQIVKAGSNAVVQWPLYPAGYLVEAETNLLSGTWSTNGLAIVPMITNGVNSIPLGTTNAAQFFRLRKPNL